MCVSSGFFQTNKRITSDTHDDDPDDFQLSIPCGLDVQFELPPKGFPDCKSWCNGTKPTPPPESGLIVSEKDNNEM